MTDLDLDHDLSDVMTGALAVRIDRKLYDAATRNRTERVSCRYDFHEFGLAGGIVLWDLGTSIVGPWHEYRVFAFMEGG